MTFINAKSGLNKLAGLGGVFLTAHIFSFAVVLNAQAEDINLTQALNKTLQQNSELKAYPYHIRAGEALKQQAQVRPSTELNLTVNNAFGTGNYQGSDNAEYSLTLSQVFELGGKRDSRRAYADVKVQQLKMEFQNSQLDVLAETSRRFYQLLKLQAQQQQWRYRVDIEQQALASIKRLSRAGAVNNADRSKMSLQLAQSKSQLMQIEQQLQQAKLSLSSMWLEASKITKAQGQLLSLPNINSNIDDLLADIKQMPAMQMQLTAARLADQQLNLMRANGSANLSTSLGIRQHAATDDQSLIASISMPINFTNPNRGRIAKAEINQQLGLQQIQWQQQKLSLQLQQIWQQVLLHQQQVEQLEQVLLPKANALLADVKQAYQTGNYSVLQWIDAQSSLFQLQQQRINHYFQLYSQLLELERISGKSLLSPKTNN